MRVGKNQLFLLFINSFIKYYNMGVGGLVIGTAVVCLVLAIIAMVSESFK